jgi:hypothetical protein
VLTPSRRRCLRLRPLPAGLPARNEARVPRSRHALLPR